MDQKRLTWAALAAIALFAVFNLANLNEYGRGYDEQRAYRRGRYSVQLVANQLGLTSALSDEKMEDLRSLYHPPLFAMAYYIASRAGEELGLDCVASRQYFIVLWSTLGLLFLFLLTSRNFGHQAGLFAVLFLIFFPPFIAHSHFNPKDVPHLVSIVIALYFFDRFIERKNTSACIVSGVTYGLAVATGLNALFLVPAFVWVISIHIHPMKDRVLRLGLWMAVAIFALYATWPFLWHEPTYFFSSIRFFTSDFMNKSIMYLGNKFTFQTLPWHYTLVHFIASTPVVTLAFFIYGVTRADKSRPLSLILPVWLILPIAARMIPGVVRYDGMRHVFLCVGPMAIYAGVGLASLKRSKVLKFLVFLWMFIEVAYLHPFEGSYVNEAVRIAIPNDVDRKFDLSIWGSPLRNGINWINQNAAPNAVVCTPSDQLECIKRPDITLSCVNPDYFLIFKESQREALGIKSDKPLYSIKRYNSTLLEVYGKTP